MLRFPRLHRRDERIREVLEKRLGETLSGEFMTNIWSGRHHQGSVSRLLSPSDGTDAPPEYVLGMSGAPAYAG